MYKRVVFGEVTKESIAQLEDINMREAFILFLLAAVVLIFGIWPEPIFEVMHVAVEQLIVHIIHTKIL